MSRREILGMTHDSATAELTRDWQGNDTITVSATLYLGDNNSQTTPLQLTEEAAQVLLSDLLRVTSPVKQLFDVEVVFKDGEGSLEVPNSTYTVRESRVDIVGDSGVRATANLADVLWVKADPAESPEPPAA